MTALRGYAMAAIEDAPPGTYAPGKSANNQAKGPAMAEETATLAAYVANLRFEDIPEEVRERAKALTLDFLGSAIRARRDAESTASLFKTLEALALDNKGESTVFGDTRTWTPAIAGCACAWGRWTSAWASSGRG